MNAIQIFQQKYGLSPDGAIGPKTFAKVCEVFTLNKEQAAHFLGQSHHESGGFERLVENMNYSAQRLADVWPARFALSSKAKVKVPNSLAKQLANKPMLIGNNVYANRMGNGVDNGFKHRGFGAIMITGKEMQDKFADFIGDPAVKHSPELIASKYPIESAIWYFNIRNVWKYCGVVDEVSILNVSKMINIGNVKAKMIPHGLEDREQRTFNYYELSKRA
jgi:putative chitinase